MTMSDVLHPNHVVAQGLAAAGYKVFPCHEAGPSIKAPMPGIFWQSASTTDVRAIDQWWRRWPTAAVGIDVAKSNIIVIDADMKHGIDGVAALHGLMRDHGCSIDDFPHVATPNNGIHVYFKQRPSHRLGNSTGDLPKGIDVRGAGGLIIAPGTVMGDDREYVPHGDVSDAVELPAWLFDLLAPRVAAQPATTFIPSKTSADEVAELEELLTYISADCGYEDWRTVLMGIHAATGGSAEGLAIADTWSATAGSAYAGRRAIEKKWQSFKSGGVTRATIAKMAEEGGANLAEIASRYSAHEERPVTEEDRRISDALWQSFERKAGIAAAADGSRELEWFDDVQPVTLAPYIVKSVLDRSAMSVVYGPSNSGKTFFALDLAYHVAVAAPWRGRRVDGGSVLYLAAEGGNGIANRIAGLKQTFGSVDVPLALRRAGLDLLKPNADVKRVIALAGEVAKREPIRLIVVDTLSRVIAGGDENAASDMTAFIRNVDAIKQATGAHVMIVHHTGKDAAKGARGHSSLRAATDTEIEIATDDFGARFAKVTKQRDYDGGEEFRFTLKPVHLGTDQDGDKVSTCIVEAEQEENSRPDDMPPMATCKAILDELSLAFNKGNPYSMTPQSQRTGRYAPRALGKKFNIEIGAMDRLLKAWLDNEIVMSSSFDKRNGRSGLTVIGSIG
jgi:hypothetical protein